MKQIKINLKLIVGLVILLSVSAAYGQDWGGGFRAGLNYNTFAGDKLDNESYDPNTSFHIGIIVKRYFTDLFGIQGEFLYTQRGAKYNFSGPSKLFVQNRNDATQMSLLSGERRMRYNVTNDYLEFPLLGFARVGPIEFSAGFSFGFLIGSFAGGTLTFDSDQPPVDVFDQELNFRFLNDKAGKISLGVDTKMIRVNNQNYAIASQLGAYTELESAEKNFFRGIETSLMAGLAVYINKGLFLLVRGNYGLNDATNDEVDINFNSFEGNYPSIEAKSIHQLSVQVSIGFSF